MLGELPEHLIAGVAIVPVRAWRIGASGGEEAAGTCAKIGDGSWLPMARPTAPRVNPRLVTSIREYPLCSLDPGPQKESQASRQALQLCAACPGTPILALDAPAL